MSKKKAQASVRRVSSDSCPAETDSGETSGTLLGVHYMGMCTRKVNWDCCGIILDSILTLSFKACGIFMCIS